MDADGDGFAATYGGDCDDTQAGVFPGADEIPYDGIDQDCSGSDLTDVDRDGESSTDAGGADCDDTRSDISSASVEVCGDSIDQDCDGEDLACPVTDADGDGFVAMSAGGPDCDDTAFSVYPGATEVPYDGIDQDCSGADLVDVDGDGESAVVAGGLDCDDTDSRVRSDGVEVCGDSVDQDCSGADQECGDVDGDLDGVTVNEGDCDDDNDQVSPNETEITYNGVDDDCSVATPDDDLDGDGFRSLTGADCDDDASSVHSGAAEVPYDGIDQDCSGADLTDVDGDGYDSFRVGGSDCDDNDPSVRPGAGEALGDLTDRDCSGGTDSVADHTLVVDETSATQDHPYVAYGTDQYLATWTDRAGANSLIRGRLFDLQASPLGDAFTISEAGLNADFSHVAFDGTNYFVVYTLRIEGINDIYGRMVDTTGALVSEETLYGQTARDDHTTVTYAGGQYLVAWRQDSTHRMYARRVGTDGVLIDSSNISFGGTSLHPDERFDTSTDGTDFFVVWSHINSDRILDIYGRFIEADGSAGPQVVISSRTGVQTTARVSFDGTRYLATFQEGNTLWGQYLDAAGAPLFTGTDTNFQISPTIDAGSAAPVAYMAGLNASMITWVDGGRLYGRLLSIAAGSLTPTLLLTGGGQFHRTPALATDGTRAFVVTDYDRGGLTGRDIGALLYSY